MMGRLDLMDKERDEDRWYPDMAAVAFPEVGAGCLERSGKDVEAIFRKYLGEITGKDAEYVEDLIGRMMDEAA